jgi:hypothetical protein
MCGIQTEDRLASQMPTQKDSQRLCMRWVQGQGLLVLQTLIAAVMPTVATAGPVHSLAPFGNSP